MSDDNKGIIQLVELVPSSEDSLDILVFEKVFRGTSPDITHLNFYLSARGDDYETAPFFAEGYSTTAASQFTPEGFVEAYLTSLQRAAHTMELILDRTDVTDICLRDQSYFAEALFRVCSKKDLGRFLSTGMGMNGVIQLQETLEQEREQLKASLVQGCKAFDALLTEITQKQATPLLRSDSARYRQGDGSVITPFSISDNL